MSEADAAYQQGYEKGFERGRQAERDERNEDPRVPDWLRARVDHSAFSIMECLPEYLRGTRFEENVRYNLGTVVECALAGPPSDKP